MDCVDVTEAGQLQFGAPDGFLNTARLGGVFGTEQQLRKCATGALLGKMPINAIPVLSCPYRACAAFINQIRIDALFPITYSAGKSGGK